MSTCEPECVCCCLPCVVGWACLYFTYTGIVSSVRYCSNNSGKIVRCQCCLSNADEDQLDDGSDTPHPHKHTSRPNHHGMEDFLEKRRRSAETIETHQIEDDHEASPDPVTIQRQPSAARAMVIQLPPKAMPPLTDRTRGGRGDITP